MTKNKHIGSRFDDFLKEKGILEEVELAAIKMVIAEQDKKEMTKRPTFEEFKERVLKDKETKEEYEKLHPEFEALKKKIMEKKERRKNKSAIFKALCENYDINDQFYTEAVQKDLEDDIDEAYQEYKAILEVAYELGLIADLCEQYPDDAFSIVQSLIISRELKNNPSLQSQKITKALKKTLEEVSKKRLIRTP